MHFSSYFGIESGHLQSAIILSFNTKFWIFAQLCITVNITDRTITGWLMTQIKALSGGNSLDKHPKPDVNSLPSPTLPHPFLPNQSYPTLPYPTLPNPTQPYTTPPFWKEKISNLVSSQSVWTILTDGLHRFVHISNRLDFSKKLYFIQQSHNYYVNWNKAKYYKCIFSSERLVDLWKPEGWCRHAIKSYLTSNNQRSAKCIWCVLLLYNWDLHVFFWLTSYYRHGHNLILLKFTIKQLEIG